MFKYREYFQKCKINFNSASLLKKFLKYNFSEIQTNYTNIKVSTLSNGVGLIQLYRPKAKNALNSALIKELNSALNDFDKDESVGCIVLGGDNHYFAAGADIKEMKDKTFTEVYSTAMLDDWHHINKIRLEFLINL
jgi:enoyl-CoA hydratase